MHGGGWWYQAVPCFDFFVISQASIGEEDNEDDGKVLIGTNGQRDDAGGLQDVRHQPSKLQGKQFPSRNFYVFQFIVSNFFVQLLGFSGSEALSTVIADRRLLVLISAACLSKGNRQPICRSGLASNVVA